MHHGGHLSVVLTGSTAACLVLLADVNCRALKWYGSCVVIIAGGSIVVAAT